MMSFKHQIIHMQKNLGFLNNMDFILTQNLKMPRPFTLLFFSVCGLSALPTNLLIKLVLIILVILLVGYMLDKKHSNFEFDEDSSEDSSDEGENESEKVVKKL